MATSMLQAISSLDHQDDLVPPDHPRWHPTTPHPGDVEHILACQGGNQITHSSTSHHPPTSSPPLQVGCVGRRMSRVG